jgi:hypothetical protein
MIYCSCVSTVMLIDLFRDDMTMPDGRAWTAEESP